MSRDVPSPIDFHDPEQAKAWVEETIRKRPARPKFFAAFVSALNGYFHGRSFSVLELGSGTGHLAEQILQNCDVQRYEALDFSDAMHALARERLARFANINFMTEDFRSAQSGTASPFDAVVTMQAAHEVRHVRHAAAFLERLRARLAPAGLLLYCDHYFEPGKNPDLMLPRDQQRTLLQGAGFRSVDCVMDDSGMALYAAVNPA